MPKVVSRHYYNEFDPHAAQWLRNLMEMGLIPFGEVDERSILDVTPNDLKGYTQCHFFAGIGGWAYALKLAGWPEDRPVWTGSCPCQPFSTAGKQEGVKDERHIWPEMFRLVRDRKPVVVFGEQVENAVGHGWLDGVFADLEGENYTCGAAVLGAHSVGAPHIRQRLYWVADGKSSKWSRIGAISDWKQSRSTDNSRVGRLANRQGVGGRGFGNYARNGAQRIGGNVSDENRSLCRPADTGRGSVQRRGGPGNAFSTPGGDDDAGDCGADGGVADTSRGRAFPKGGGRDAGRSVVPNFRQDADIGRPAFDFWNDYELVPCENGKSRRVESGLSCLVDGVPFRLADGRTRKGTTRVQIIKKFGNAIVPQVAAQFILAFLDARQR